jgi:two-component system response regulator AtoC
VRDGTFRQDLYYRLNVVSVALPALRARSDDLPLLIERFLAAAAGRLKRPLRPLAAPAYRALLAHDWPGNVRELEHAIEQAVALASGDEIGVDDLPAAVRGGDAGTGEDSSLQASFKDAKQRVIERFERGYITQALTRHQGNVSKAAEDMGMYRQHLQVKLAEYGIDAEVFRGRRGGR